jgi:hypothetical protein
MSRPKRKKTPTEIELTPLTGPDYAQLVRALTGLLSAGTERLAFSIPDLVNVVGLSRGYLIGVMDDGRLVALKADSRTIVLRTDLLRFLENLPVRPPKAAVTHTSSSRSGGP